MSSKHNNINGLQVFLSDTCDRYDLP